MSIGSISGYSFNQVKQQDPNSYAQEYANKNGLTLEEAKAELKAKYGDPKKPEEMGGVDTSIFNKTDTAVNNTALPNDSDTDIAGMLNKIGDPDSFAQFYADEKGISLDEAKNELRELVGEPRAPEMNTGAQNNESSISDLISRILNFLKGGDGPQKEGDPEYQENNLEI